LADAVEKVENSVKRKSCPDEALSDIRNPTPLQFNSGSRSRVLGESGVPPLANDDSVLSLLRNFHGGQNFPFSTASALSDSLTVVTSGQQLTAMQTWPSQRR